MIDAQYFFKKNKSKAIENPTLFFGDVEANFLKLKDFLTQKKISPADMIILEPDEKNNISIESLKEAMIKANRLPFNSPSRALIIKHAQALSLPSQHAFLKTLEEPSRYTHIFLLCKDNDSLIKTILSRVEIFYQKHKYEKRDIDLEKLVNSSLADRLLFAQENVESIQDFNGFLDSLLIFFNDDLNRLHKAKNLIQKIYEAKYFLKANVSHKLILEYILTE